jgi:hypothetical protein
VAEEAKTTQGSPLARDSRHVPQSQQRITGSLSGFTEDRLHCPPESARFTVTQFAEDRIYAAEVASSLLSFHDCLPRHAANEAEILGAGKLNGLAIGQPKTESDFGLHI